MKTISPLTASEPHDLTFSQVLSPWNQQPIAKLHKICRASADEAIDAAYSLFQHRSRWLSLSKRLQIIEKVCVYIEKNKESFATQAAEEGGKPLKDSLIETNRAITTLKSCVSHFHASHAHGQCIPMGIDPSCENRLAFTTHEPIGVVLAFSAFNHPLNLIAHQIGPAIAAGCPTIIKPAEATPISGFNLVKAFHECGLPVEYCQAVLCDGRETNTHMVSSPKIGFFSFIGSGKVGWMLRQKLAAGTRCSLEHGGCAPVIVDRQANLSEALPLLARGGFYHAGQVCVSVQRVFVPAEMATDFAARLADLARKMIVGDPTLRTTDVGPLITPANVSRVDGCVRGAKEAGARVMCGGQPEDIGHNTYACTVLLDPPDDAQISREEIFGPVVCVYSYQDVDEAIRRANALPMSFQASVISDNLDRALYFAKRLNASAVMINDHTAFRVDWMPFAGHLESGHGTGGVPYTIEEMSCKKMIVVRSSSL